MQNLQEGHANPYNPDIVLPEVPNFDPEEAARRLDEAMKNLERIPKPPTYLPKIVHDMWVDNLPDDDDDDVTINHLPDVYDNMRMLLYKRM